MIECEPGSLMATKCLTECTRCRYSMAPLTRCWHPDFLRLGVHAVEGGKCARWATRYQDLPPLKDPDEDTIPVYGNVREGETVRVPVLEFLKATNVTKDVASLSSKVAEIREEIDGEGGPIDEKPMSFYSRIFDLEKQLKELLRVIGKENIQISLRISELEQRVDAMKNGNSIADLQGFFRAQIEDYKKLETRLAMLEGAAFKSNTYTVGGEAFPPSGVLDHEAH